MKDPAIRNTPKSNKDPPPQSAARTTAKWAVNRFVDNTYLSFHSPTQRTTCKPLYHALPWYARRRTHRPGTTERFAASSIWQAAALSPGDILRWDCLHKPHAVLRQVERVPRSSHCRRVHAQNDRFAPASADLPSGIDIRGQMNVLPGPPLKAGCEDGLHAVLDGAMEQRGRWTYRLEPEVNGSAMALIGANLPTVFGQGEPLFIAGGDDVPKLLWRDCNPVPPRTGQQFVYTHPALGIQRHTGSLRPMA